MDAPVTVSVVIPVYNDEKWIAQTIESVLAQTYRDFEIIAVDDGSTDRSAEILQRYPAVRYIRQPNRGQAAALNTGVKAARGWLIAFLDSDDLWLPEKIEACVEALRANPDAVLCYTNGDAIGPDGAPLWRLLPDDHQPPSTPAEMLLNCVICCPSQVVVRAMHLETFTEELQSNDHDQWVRMREKGPFVYVGKALTQYRRHPGQMSLSRRQWEDGFKILRAARKRYPYSLTTLAKRSAVIHFRLGEHDLRNGTRVRGLLHWIQAALLDPARALKTVVRNRG